MSAHAGTKNTVESAAPVESYDRLIKAVHWSTLLLIGAAYGAVWASHAVATKEQHAILVELHRSLGVTIFALTVFRLAWRWHARAGRPSGHSESGGARHRIWPLRPNDGTGDPWDPAH